METWWRLGNGPCFTPSASLNVSHFDDWLHAVVVTSRGELADMGGDFSDGAMGLYDTAGVAGTTASSLELAVVPSAPLTGLAIGEKT